MLTLYNALHVPLRIAASVWSALTARTPERRAEWAERLGRSTPDVPPGGIWLHGASVGEVRVLGEILGGLRAAAFGGPIVVSAVTRTGRSLLPAPPDVAAAFFAPLDFRDATRRVFGAVAPRLLGVVETELWPNLFAEARERAVPTLLLNGRLAPDKMRRYRRLAGLYAPLLRGLAEVGAQSQADAERFESLGVPPARIRVTGNVKYDFRPPDVSTVELRRRLGIAPERPVFVAGSTAEGEDRAVLDGFGEARRAEPGLLLILAPRHPERADAVERLVRERGLDVRRISREPAGPGNAPDVILVDGVGLLSRLYSIAQVAFVGGSLVPSGGHNVLEPAAARVPVLFGPHTEHVAEPAGALVDGGGAFRVRGPDELARRVVELLGDDDARERAADRARDQVRRNQGALDRTVELIRSHLDSGRTERGPA
jgi:3-deoxy-D-manno-octulosonic-acid transferase